MPDQLAPTAPVAAEGSTPTPEVVPSTPAERPEPTRQERIAEWLKAPAPPAKAVEEAPAKPAAEAEPAAQDALSQSKTDEVAAQPLPDGDLGKAVRRIRLLKDERKELKAGLTSAEERIKALEAETEALRAKATPAAPRPQADFSAVEDPAELDTVVGESQKVFQWADSRLDRVVSEEDAAAIGAELEAEGIEPPEEGWTVRSARKPLLALKENSRTKLVAASARSEWLRAEQSNTEQMARLVPELLDEKSPLADEVRGIVKARPWLKRLPDWPLLSTVAALGLRELERLQKPQAKPAPVAAALPKAPRLPGAPARALPDPPSKLEELRKKAIRPGATPEERQAWIRESLLKGG